MPLFDHFSLAAPFYERFLPFREPEMLLSLLGLPVKGAVLDAGGGTGRVAQVVAKQANLVVVIDESKGMLLQAANKPGVRPARAPSERLPLLDQAFERVIMVDAFHHVANQKATASELWRVLQPGGRIVIMEPDIRKFAVKLVAIGEKLALMRSHFLTPSEIAKLFPNPKAKVSIETDRFNAYILVEK